jgi:hypothetical protein
MVHCHAKYHITSGSLVIDIEPKASAIMFLYILQQRQQKSNNICVFL